MTSDGALVKLGQSTSEAICGVLEQHAPGQVSPGGTAVVAAAEHPLAGIPVPAVATMVSYEAGATGGNLFVMTVEGARRLAAAMMGTEPGAGGELSELELSAVAEAMNQMMSSAAAATTAVLGADVEIGPPETCTFNAAEAAVAAYGRTPHATVSEVKVCGEPCRFVQFVPNAFVVRMTRALDELAAEAAVGTLTTGVAGATPSLDGIPVRVWAELGRTRMSTAQIVGLPPGAVVELNRGPDEPIDLYVNGRHFATGRLMVVDGAEWAVRIETLTESRPDRTNTVPGGA